MTQLLTWIAVGLFLLAWMVLTVVERRRHPGMDPSWGPIHGSPRMRAMERLIQACLTALQWILGGLGIVGGYLVLQWLGWVR